MENSNLGNFHYIKLNRANFPESYTKKWKGK